MNTRAWARGLGWFSIALGVTEIACAAPLARALGMKSTALLRAYGIRELAAGVGLLTQQKKGPWIWARIAGDALDAVTLASGLSSKNPKRANVALAIAAVSPVIVADIVCGKRLGLAA